MEDNEEIVKIIEKLREDEIMVQHSREYRIGLKITNALEHIKKLQFGEYIKREINNNRIKKYNMRLSNKKDDFDYGNFGDEHKKFVVYTCITGGYDGLMAPLYRHKDIDYIAYTDNPQIETEVWQLREIPASLEYLNNNIMINRYLKFHPSEFFSEYDYALYIDGNILVVSDIRNMVNRVNISTGLAFHRHSCRNCIYKEAEVCRIEKKGDHKKISEQLERYKNIGFPKQFGLYEANIILSDLRNASGKFILEEWWREFKESESFRDQIALPFAVWKCGFQFDEIGNLGFDMHLNPKFKKVNHR